MDKRAKEVNSLLLKIQRGEEKALDELYLGYGAFLLSMAKRYLIDKTMAEDVLSEVFLELFNKKAKSFDVRFNGLNWLFKITKNTALRMNKSNKLVAVEEIEEMASLADVLTYKDDITDKIGIKLALEKLTEYENKLLYLKYWEGLTIREIAAEVKKPRSTVHIDVNRALDKMKGFLE